MRFSSGTVLFGAVLLVSGCGARTSADELLGGSSTVRSTGGAGGGAPVGGSGGVFVGGGGSGASGGAYPGGGGSGGAGPCCTAVSNAGCGDPYIEECVCFLDEYCCTVSWDDVCVDEVGACADSCSTGGAGGVPGGGGVGGFTGGAGGVSGGGGVGGFTGGSGGGGECCTASASAGCVDADVEACVCGFDNYCCTTSWDSICVEEVGACGEPCGAGGAGGSGGGGAPGGGGSGGTQNCEVAFPGACEQCLCESCYGELTTCLSDLGCLAVAGCALGSGCSGLDCLSTCGSVIASVGGITSPSVAAALGYASCAAQSSCDACF